MKIEFFVPGIPKPAGSKRAFLNKKTGKIIVTEDCETSGDWRGDCKNFARKAYHENPIDGPVSLSVIFYMPRPKGHFGTGKKAGILKPNAPRWHTVKPDRTKLTRGLEDALTGIIWRDDSQVVCGEVVKIYGDLPGANITVEAD